MITTLWRKRFRMAAKHVTETLKIPSDLTLDEISKLKKQVLRFIRKRTSEGKGKGGKSFPSYTEEYKRSLDFKNAQKSASKVNLKLSGDMIAAMDILPSKKNEITYGFEKGTSENDRAEGNIIGSYGKKSADPKKARDFLGMTNEELALLVKKVRENG